MVTLQEAIRALEAIRNAPPGKATDVDRRLAVGIEGLLWLYLEEKKKLDEVEIVLAAVKRILERVEAELIDDHNRDVDAIAASLDSVAGVVESMRRVS